MARAKAQSQAKVPAKTAKAARGAEPGRWTAVYVRTSHKGRRTELQGSDLQRWSELKGWAEAREGEVKWYRDGYTAGRRGAAWSRLLKDVEAGRVATIVCWRLDRLAMTCSELVKLFERLTAHRVNLISLKDGLDLATPSGRRMAGLLASIAVYESEVRAERIIEGQEAARARGVRWGGSVKGRRIRVTPEREATIRDLKAEGAGVTRISRATGLSRPTVYRVLGEIAAAQAAASRRERRATAGAAKTKATATPKARTAATARTKTKPKAKAKAKAKVRRGS